jgi:hypothetical protein
MKESLNLHHESVPSREQFEREIFPTLENPLAIRQLDGLQRQYAKELFREYGFQLRVAIAGLRSELEDWIFQADESGSLNRNNLQEELDDIMTDIYDLQWAQHPYFRSKLSEIDTISDTLIAQFFERYYKLLGLAEQDSDTIIQKLMQNSDGYSVDLAQTVEITHSPFAINLNFTSRKHFLRFLAEDPSDETLLGRFYVSSDGVPVTVEFAGKAFDHEQDHAINAAFGRNYTEQSISENERDVEITNILKQAKDELVIQYLDGISLDEVMYSFTQGSYFEDYTESLDNQQTKQYQRIITKAITTLFSREIAVDPVGLVEQLFVTPIVRWADEIDRLESATAQTVTHSNTDVSFSKAA